MNCHFKINTVRFVHALHALRKIADYLPYLGLTDFESDSLEEFLGRVEAAYSDFLNRDITQSCSKSYSNASMPKAGRAKARLSFGKDFTKDGANMFDAFLEVF